MVVEFAGFVLAGTRGLLFPSFMTLADLPAVNAALNGLAAVLLVCGHRFIRRQNIVAHRRCMVSALICSALFLACYITYHGYVAYTLHKGPTVFREPAWFRPVYLTILFTHTPLAICILPMIVITLSRALKQRFDLHRKIARWTYPLWMYVSVTGVLIYLLLYQIFPQK